MLSDKEKLEHQTPKFLADLGYKFLFIAKDEVVADIACGTGEFLKYVLNKKDDVCLYGCELSADVYQELICNEELDSKNATFEMRDAFSLIGEKEFDKIFVHPPFGKRMHIDGALEVFLTNTLKEDSFCRETSNSDLLFAILTTQLIKEDGYAIVIVSTSSCSNTAGKFLRKCLVNSGYLNMVISLPSKMLANTSVPIVALGLRKNSDKVWMIDATNFGTKEGRKQLREGSGAEHILFAYKTGSEDVAHISQEKIEQEDYDFLPQKYFEPIFSHKYSVSLCEILRILRRGVINGSKSKISGKVSKSNNSKSKSELMRQESLVNTVSFVRASNIEDAVFFGQLDNIEQEYVPNNAILLEEGDILLSKTGEPFKCAVIDKPLEKPTCFQENLYMLRVDEYKINPYYLCAFLNSTNGQKILSKAMVNGGTSSLPIQKLKQIKIPLPKMDKQEKIGADFQHACEDIKAAKQKVEEEISALETKLMNYF